MLSYAINLVLLAALLACTGYMLLVARRLKALRSGQDQIGPMVVHFARLTTEMSANLDNLKGEAGKAALALEEAVGRAQKKQEEIEMALMSADVERKMAARAMPVTLPETLPTLRSVPDGRDVIDLQPATRKAAPAEPIARPQWARAKPAMGDGAAVVESQVRPADRSGSERDRAISQAIAAFYGPDRAKAGG